MSYAYEAGMPTARRRRRRALLLTLIALALVAAVLGIRALLHGPDDVTPTAAPTTTCLHPPAGITVDVYNATSRAGLAGVTADTLRAQRFEVGTVTNAPAGTTVTAPAEIRHGKNGAAGAAVLARHIRGAVLREIPREGTTVDLFVGPDLGAVTAPSGSPSC